MKRLTILSISLLVLGNVSAQKKNITLDDIWKTGTFRANAVFGLVSMNDGSHYSTMDGGKILQYEYAKKEASLKLPNRYF